MKRLLAIAIKPRRTPLLVRTLVLASASAALTFGFMHTGIGERLEQRTIDARFAERGTIEAPKDVVVVAIDRTQDSYGGTWPISRQLWASAIDNLSDAGVAAVAIDVPMDWKAANPQEDATFMEALRESDVPVVLSTGGFEGGVLPDDAFSGLDRAARRMATTARPPIPVGVSVREPATDGTVRDYAMLFPSLPGEPPLESLAGRLVEAAGAGDATDRASDTMPLGYYGPRQTFEHVSFANVAYGLDRTRDLQGRIVLIGPTEGLGRDDHDVPMGGRMSSVEIQATAVANLLDGTWLRTPGAWVEPLAVAAMVIAIWALLLVVPLGLAVPASVALVAGWGWLSVDMFERGLALPMLAPMLAGSVAFATLSVTLATLAVRERIRVKGLFARYVHADVVRELVDGEDRIELGGEEREITVLFSDIRGFTSMSEHVDPVEMVAQLNEYFEAMVDVVAAEQGAVDKFLGDGLMAIFGAPVRHDDHAERACRAATAMLARLEQVNVGRAQRGLQPLRIGIGIHTGLAVVGNVGSPPFRVDFTAIGDTVNLAARIEAMTKELSATIVASEATRAAVARTCPDGILEFQSLGTVVARGRTEPTVVHSLRTEVDRSEQDVRPAA